ncbi:PEP-CTERM sorting domain-containing protein [Rubrivivax rivuli]|uniref:PEP-CTERM sorting domain-containing protein n=1 Tax=Rubrivivax rivuli TaxID=1862385 RepID=A0A437RRR2_9BURK|nr:PEP-CTERM sorting domain-containing protein [Rubrivivax rivuli]RVU49474.1 PEP-CTERM sorting domain-containing protein [Rubrivivax rivuli]
MNASTSSRKAPATAPAACMGVSATTAALPKHRHRRVRWAAITGALLCLAAQMQAQAQTAAPRATVQVLPTLGGNFSAARGVNDLGQVVGSSSDGAVTRGFLWQAGSGMQALTPASVSGDAMAINNAGQVAGRYLEGNRRSAPFLWSASTGLRVLPVPSGEPSGAALALNEAGVAAGYWSGPYVDRGMRWGNDGSLLELQPQDRQVTGINDAGQMVGGLFGVGQLWQADGSVTALPSLAPRDINNLGVVVGMGLITNPNTPQTTVQAFIWQATTGTRSLGHLGAGTSAALALNDFGQVVGSSRLAGASANVAMLWREGAGMSNLSALAGAGVNPVEASGINSFAQVVGTASTSAGSRAFLMTLHPDWNGGDGAWDDSTGQRWNWAGTGTAAARVGAMHDVVIDPGRSATVRGSADGQARSLRIGGTAGHLVTLDLNGGTTRLSDGNVATFTESAIANGGVLRGSGRLETGDDLRVRAGGRIEVGAGEQQQLAVAYLDNQGTVRAQGTAFAPARLQVSGGAFYTQAGARLQLQHADAVLASGLSNFGEVSLQNAHISMPEGAGAPQLFNAGTLAFSFGDSSITGKVTNNGLLVVSNGARASFYGSVVHRGELRVSAGGAASFFGRVEGTGVLTGTGEVRFEGGLALGSTPTVLHVTPRAVVASEVALNLGGGPPEAAGGPAGPAGALAHDRIVFNGAVLLDGATLSLADGSALAAGLAAGSAFDLFDWNGGVSGSFTTLALPALAEGLAWDTSDLYTGGALSVTAVPEPATWALMLGGLACGLLRRRQRSGLAAVAPRNAGETPAAHHADVEPQAGTAPFTISSRRAPCI